MVWQHGHMEFVGRLLVATPLITEDSFIHTVIYVYAAESEAGTAGVILNRVTTTPAVGQLPTWRGILSGPPMVFWGGPVAPESGIVLTVVDGVIDVAVDLEPPPKPARARLFVGQAGWGPGQLEAEIAEGAWLVTEAFGSDVITADPDHLWAAVLRREGGRPAVWATHPLDLTMN